MGLDMYLKGKVWLDYNGTQRKQVACLIDMPDFEASTIEVELGYWRKANHIHKWFVDNVQFGRDDCEEHLVHQKDLERLLAVCQAVLAAPSMAEELLPTQQGFFFGSTEYGDDYMDDVRQTVVILSRALKLKKNMDMVYRSSW